MPKVRVSPDMCQVTPGEPAIFTAIFLDNNDNRTGPETPSQLHPRLVSGRGVLGAPVIKDEGAVFSFTPHSQHCVIEVGGAGVMDPPLVTVRAKTPFGVMPNSIFEGVVMSTAAHCEPCTTTPPEFTEPRSGQSLNGKWRYFADREPVAGRAEEFYARPELDDSAWGEMKVPCNFSLEDKTLADFYGAVWFRRAFRVDGKHRSRHKRFKLRFEGADYLVKVWLNGKLLGAHEGYFNPFEFDITHQLHDGENIVA
ncbi:MAG: sugar-binding domain-containing protein, partial [Myxococcota bacterium]